MQRNLCHHNTSTGTYRTYTASGPVYESPDKAVWCGVGELSDGRQFFVKILDCGRIADAETAAEMAQLYRTEARTLKTIGDCRVSVPKCYDYWRDNRTGQSVIVMERMKGVSLREWMRAHPAQNLSRRDVRERLDILLQICRIMMRIYEKHPNVIHRDLKPENILIEENRNRSRKVSVVDFGCAGQDRMRIGTVNYQSPEQTGIFTGNIGISTKNDIFSIGQIGYELIHALHFGLHILRVLVREPVQFPAVQQSLKRQILQGGQHDIVPDGFIDDDAFVVPVFGCIGHGMLDRGGNIVDFRPVRQADLAGPVPAGAEDRLPHLVHSAFAQPAEAQDFSPVEVKGDSLDLPRHGNILNREDNLAADGFTVVGPVIGVADFPAHHQAFQVILADVLCPNSIDVFSVPQHTHGVRSRQNLAQIVADENHAASVCPDRVHDLVQLQAPVLG